VLIASRLDLSYDEKIFREIDRAANYIDFWRAMFPAEQIKDAANQLVKCPFHADDTASLSICNNSTWKCQACGEHGNGIDFLKKFNKWEGIKALEWMADFAGIAKDKYKVVGKPQKKPKQEYVDNFHLRLMTSTQVLDNLTDKKDITHEVIKKYKVGWDGERYTFPVYNESGELINVRRYKIKTGSKDIKTLPYGRGLEIGLFPHPVDESPWRLLLEGETDALVGRSLGLPSVTVCGGAQTWFEHWNKYFSGKRVVICYDADQAGLSGAPKIAKSLLESEEPPSEVRVVILQGPKGYDFSDYISDGNSKDDFIALIKATPPYQVVAKVIEGVPHAKIHLSQASRAEYFNKRIEVESIVSGKDLAPFIAPLHVSFSCEPTDSSTCKNCICSSSGGKTDHEFDEEDIELVGLINVSKDIQERLIRKRVGIPANCRNVSMEVAKPINIEQLRLIPDVDFSTDEVEYVARTAFYIGHGLKANTKYKFRGKTLPDPRSQHAVHLFREAKTAIDSIDKWKLTEERAESLLRFQPSKKLSTTLPKVIHSPENRDVNDNAGLRGHLSGYTQVIHSQNTNDINDLGELSTPEQMFHLDKKANNNSSSSSKEEREKNLSSSPPFGYSTLDIHLKLTEIYSEFENITGIRQRHDLFFIIDLSYHSILRLEFQGKLIKGWVEVLIIGDTRQGKSYVGKGLLRHYRAGELIGGESLSLAGLKGGLTQAGGRWNLSWGKIPLNDRRLVIVDEASGIQLEDIEELSGMRSEGVAEIVKVVTERTTARVRMIWMSNPRSPMPLSSYAYGIEAVKELIGRQEDISRFDAALAVATGEVNVDIVNQEFIPLKNPIYTAEACHDLVMWAWSRKPSDVKFSAETTTAILEHSIRMGRRYSSRIPLVEPAEQRIKLCRMATSLAARLFSTSTGEDVVVLPVHVEYVTRRLDEIYSRQSLGYFDYSKAILKTENLEDSVEIRKDLHESEVELLLENAYFNLSGIMDFFEFEEAKTGKALLRKWVKLHAVTKHRGNSYKKTSAFIALLKKIQAEYERSDNTSFGYGALDDEGEDEF